VGEETEGKKIKLKDIASLTQSQTRVKIDRIVEKRNEIHAEFAITVEGTNVEVRFLSKMENDIRNTLLVKVKDIETLYNKLIEKSTKTLPPSGDILPSGKTVSIGYHKPSHSSVYGYVDCWVEAKGNIPFLAGRLKLLAQNDSTYDKEFKQAIQKILKARIK